MTTFTKIQDFDVRTARELKKELDIASAYAELTPSQRGSLKTIMHCIERDEKLPKEFKASECEICVIAGYVGLRDNSNQLLVEEFEELVIYDIDKLEKEATFPKNSNMSITNDNLHPASIPIDLIRFKHSNKPATKEFKTVLKKLQYNKASVTPELMREIYDIPEIKRAKIVADNMPLTVDTYDEKTLLEREENTKELLKSNNGFATEEDMLDNLGEKFDVRQDRKAFIVLGLPSSGKSSVITNRLLKENRAFLLDSDESKQTLPEFNNGLGANAVHKESKRINFSLFTEISKTGTNLVIPKVGDSVSSIENLINTLNDLNYTVQLHLVEVEPNTAMCRMLKRYAGTNRFLDPKLIGNYGNKPNEVFEQLKGENYVKWSNEVEWYDEPILLSQSGDEY